MTNQQANQGVLAFDLPPTGERRFWFDDRTLPTNRNKDPKPTFRIAEVAKIFFARSADWMRWLVSEHDDHGNVFVLDGVELVTQRTPSGSRTYTLPEIEKIAVALHANRRINDEQYLFTMNTLRWVGAGYKIIPIMELVNPAAVRTEIDGQLSILDTQCEECAKNEHQDCEVATEIHYIMSNTVQQVATGKGEAQVRSSCSCYTDNPKQHGMAT